MLFHALKFVLNFLIMASAWRLLHVSRRVILDFDFWPSGDLVRDSDGKENKKTTPVCYNKREPSRIPVLNHEWPGKPTEHREHLYCFCRYCSTGACAYSHRLACPRMPGSNKFLSPKPEPFGHSRLCHVKVRFAIAFLYRKKFALLQRQAERNVSGLIKSL